MSWKWGNLLSELLIASWRYVLLMSLTHHITWSIFRKLSYIKPSYSTKVFLKKFLNVTTLICSKSFLHAAQGNPPSRASGGIQAVRHIHLSENSFIYQYCVEQKTNEIGIAQEIKVN